MSLNKSVRLPVALALFAEREKAQGPFRALLTAKARAVEHVKGTNSAYDDFAKLVGVSGRTVRRYLDKCVTLGWALRSPQTKTVKFLSWKRIAAKLDDGTPGHCRRWARLPAEYCQNQFDAYVSAGVVYGYLAHISVDAETRRQRSSDARDRKAARCRRDNTRTRSTRHRTSSGPVALEFAVKVVGYASISSAQDARNRASKTGLVDLYPRREKLANASPKEVAHLRLHHPQGKAIRSIRGIVYVDHPTEAYAKFNLVPGPRVKQRVTSRNPVQPVAASATQ